MKKINIILLIALILLISSCAAEQRFSKVQPYPVMKLYAGADKGGIIENTDMNLLENTIPDAYTGATRTGLHLGARYEYPLKRVAIETGLDIVVNDQTLQYQDPINNYHGKRDLLSSHFRVPLMLSFGMFRKTQPDGILKLKIGVSPGFSLIKIEDHSADLPEPEISSFNMGPVMGMEIYPFSFEERSTLGMYFSVFRSAQSVYTDFYQAGGMPGLSYLSFGITWKIH